MESQGMKGLFKGKFVCVYVYVCLYVGYKSKEGLQKAQLFHTHPDVRKIYRATERQKETCKDLCCTDQRKK